MLQPTAGASPAGETRYTTVHAPTDHRSKMCLGCSYLESLVGPLVHTTKVCPLYLSGLFQILQGMKRGQPQHLNLATRADLARWHSLLSTWLGISTHQFLVLGRPNKHLFSDASGAWGCGAWLLLNWFQVLWSQATASIYCAERTCANCASHSSLGGVLERPVHPLPLGQLSGS